MPPLPSQTPIPVIVSGALGKMGSEVVRTIINSSDCELVGAIDTSIGMEGKDIAIELGMQESQVAITADFEGTLCNVSQSVNKSKDSPPAVLVDFTHPSVAYEHTRASIAYGINPVIGTTGFKVSEIESLAEFSIKASVGGAIIPNFSVGMVLLQQAASVAASFYDNAELIELHHNQKADSPSGTCIKTAEMLEELGKSFNQSNINEEENLRGCRGGVRSSGLNIHAIRLPGLVAHQQVIFGSVGETYSLRHDTIDRKAYMPGVLLTISKVIKLNSLVYGLEKII